MLSDIVQTATGYRATRNGVVLHIPNDPANHDWQAVQAAIAAGAQVGLPPSDGVPQVVSRFQAKEALRRAGLLTSADAIVTASNDPTLQNAWANANEFRRDSVGINTLAPLIGLDAAELDDLFRTAAGIVA